jgi:hypothetical protein
MASSVAEYYINELNDWKDSIDFHLDEINQYEEWLSGIINKDSIPKLAGSIEHYLNEIFMSKANFVQTKDKLDLAEKVLLKGMVPLENPQVTDTMKSQQKDLRKNMWQMEKDYLDAKFNWDQFLSDSIEKD